MIARPKAHVHLLNSASLAGAAHRKYQLQEVFPWA